MHNFKSYIKLILSLAFILVNMVLNAQNIKKHKWKHRVLILKTTDVNNENYKLQMEVFKDQEKSLIDRKLILYKLVGQQYELVSFEGLQSIETGKVSDPFLKRYALNNEDFKIILLGLDGGIKLTQQNVLGTDKLYNIIDAMPMRKNEIKTRTKN